MTRRRGALLPIATPRRRPRFVPHLHEAQAALELLLTGRSLKPAEALAKKVVRAAGIDTPNFQLMTTGRERLDKQFTRWPLMVKPVAEGSSKGVVQKSVCHSEAELRGVVKELVDRYDQPALIEEYIDGRELTVRNRADRLTELIALAMAHDAAPVDLAIFNGGSVRIDDVLPPGEITVYDVLRILPFGNKTVRAGIDGVLLEREVLHVANSVLALELDDRSHERPDRRRRDRLVEQALARAGLPLLRLRPARSWPELPQLLHEALGRSPLTKAACPPNPRPAKAPRTDGVPA